MPVAMTETTPALWKHQEDAVEFAGERPATLYHMGLGTGKSRCAIEVARNADAKQILILCPLSVVPAWKEQFSRFGPEFEVAVLNKGSVKKKLKEAARVAMMAAAELRPFVIVINYESARGEPFSSWAMGLKWDLLVMDESHRIKSPKGITSRWVSRLAKICPKKLALTGTPMPHSPLDIYAQMRSLDPTIFGWSFFKFRLRYAKMGGFGGKQVVGFQNIDVLRERMSKVTFQADRSVLDLPDAIHEKRVIELSPKGRKIYEELDRDFCAQVKEGEIVASNALVKLLRLQQVTSGLVTIDSDPPELIQVDRSKEQAVADLLEDLPMDEPVIIFGRFRSDLAAVHAAAKSLDRESLELSGGRKELEAWQAGAAPILAVQIQAGGVGIDLTRAAYCVYLSTGFSLGDYEQSVARCHRPGQDRTVFYYHILVKDSVDERVYAALRQRKNVVEAVLADIYSEKEETF